MKCRFKSITTKSLSVFVPLLGLVTVLISSGFYFNASMTTATIITMVIIHNTNIQNEDEELNGFRTSIAARL